MSKIFPSEGVVVALWSPTNRESSIDTAAVGRNIAFLQNKGLAGLLVLGSTGEFPFLSIEQRKLLLETSVKHAGKLPIMANISDVNPHNSIELGRFARSIGIPAFSILPPWYFKRSQEDLAEFFVRITEAVGLPVILYNFPERTGNTIELETIAAVADRVPVIGFKQSGGRPEFHGPIVDLCRKRNIWVMTGADCDLPQIIPQGVTGCISGIANATPEMVVSVVNDLRAGKTAAGQAQIDRIAQAMSGLDFPLSVHCLMQAAGLDAGELKTFVASSTVKKMDAARAGLKKILGR